MCIELILGKIVERYIARFSYKSHNINRDFDTLMIPEILKTENNKEK